MSIVMRPEQMFGAVDRSTERYEDGFHARLKDGRFVEAERRAARIALIGAPSDALFEKYVKRFVYSQNFGEHRRLLRSRNLTPRQRLIATALLASERGFDVEAKAILLRAGKDHLDDLFFWRATWFVAGRAADYDLIVDAGLHCLRLDGANQYRLAKGVAMAAERIRRVGPMREALRRAFCDAEACLLDKAAFRKEYVKLTHFWLGVFDVARAERVASLARKRSLPLADQLIEAIDRLKAETRGWEVEIAAAAREVRDLVRNQRRPTEEGEVEVMISSAAMTFKLNENPIFRSTLRFVQGSIFETLREKGLPYRIRAKLDSQSPTVGRKDRPLISYHTASGPGRTLHFKEAYQPGYVTFDPKGYAGWTTFADQTLEDMRLDRIDAKEAVRFFETRARDVIAHNVSKYFQPDRAEAETLGEGYVFVGLQVLHDSVQRLSYMPMLDMLEVVLEYCSERRIPVVVKRHPMCASPRVGQRLKFGVETGQFRTTEASVHDVLAGARAVCVVNSGVGYEALFHRKPVYLFGKADYHHACRNVTGPTAFREMFSERMPVDDVTLARYVYHMNKNYFINCNNRDAASRKIRNRVGRYLAAKHLAPERLAAEGPSPVASLEGEPRLALVRT